MNENFHSKMDLAKSCRNGDIEECRRLCNAGDKQSEPISGELSAVHWLMLGTNTSDENCLVIMDILNGAGVNHAANDVSLQGSSRIDRVSNVSPLHLAVLYKGTTVVEKLLSMGATLDSQDSNGETALMYAARGGKLDKANLLLGAGANCAVLSLSGESAFSLSVCDEVQGAIQLFLDKHLLRGLKGRDPDAVERLLRAKANPAAADESGTSALSCALQCGGYSTVIAILESGKDWSFVGESGSTCLHEALVSGSLDAEEKLEVLSELIYLKANVNGRNCEGKTPLELALGTEDLVKLLLDNGAEGLVKPARTVPPSPYSGYVPEPLSPQMETLEPGSPVVQFTQSQAARDGLSSVTIDLGELASRAGTLIAELEMSNRFVESIGKHNAQVDGFAQQSVLLPSRNVCTEEELLTAKVALVTKLAVLESEFGELKSANRSLTDFRAIGHFMDVQKALADVRSELGGVQQKLDRADFIQGKEAPLEAPVVVVDSGSWFRSPDSVEADIENCVRAIRKGTGNVVGVDCAVFAFIRSGGNLPSSSQSTQIIRLLMNRGSDVNYREPATGLTALMLVCDTPNASDELVSFLLSNSADLNLVDSIKGWSCMHFAARQANSRICQLLLKRAGGQLASLADRSGKLAADYCSNPSIQQLLSS